MATITKIHLLKRTVLLLRGIGLHFKEFAQEEADPMSWDVNI